MSEREPIKTKALLRAIKSVESGGFRVTFDVFEEDTVPVMAMMPAIKKVVEITVLPAEENN